MKKKIVTLPGTDLDATVSPVEEIEALTEEIIVVCMPASSPSNFPDDIEGVCAECGMKIRERPHNPKNGRRLCFGCAVPLISEAVKKGDVPELHVSDKSWDEAMPFLKKPH